MFSETSPFVTTVGETEQSPPSEDFLVPKATSS